MGDKWNADNLCKSRYSTLLLTKSKSDTDLRIKFLFGFVLRNNVNEIDKLVPVFDPFGTLRGCIRTHSGRRGGWGILFMYFVLCYFSADKKKQNKKHCIFFEGIPSVKKNNFILLNKIGIVLGRYCTPSFPLFNPWFHRPPSPSQPPCLTPGLTELATAT